MNKIVGDEPCPKCRENGRDSTGNHLMVFEDGNKYCNRCGYYEPVVGWTSPEKPSEPVSKETNGMTLQEVQKLPIAALKARGIDKDICENEGIRVEYSTSTGEEKGYYYPVYVNGKIIAYKNRVLPKDFYWVGSIKGKKPELFGQHTCQKGGKKLLICGGQDDYLSAKQMLWRKYPNFPPNVVSLIHGEKPGSVADNLDFVNSFEEVLIYTDMDEVGRKCAEDIAKLVGPKAKIVETSLKDANEMLLKGKQAEFINAFFSAKSFTPVGLVEGGIGLEEVLTPIQKGIMLSRFPGTMQKLQGLRKAELTLILAPAGVGKTTITKEWGIDLIGQGQKVEHFFLEEDLKKTQQSYIAMANDVHLARFRQDPSCIPREKVEEAYKKYVEGQLYLDHWGSMSPAEVMSNFRYGAAWGATFGVLDHISMVFSGTETTNERKDIDKLMTDLAAFTRESGMHIIIISHIKRANKPFRKKEDYPYWETVASDAGRGSGAFEQLADNIITLEVEYLDEDMNKGKIRTRVAKNREWSTLGVGDVLNYNMNTGRISPETGLKLRGDY